MKFKKIISLFLIFVLVLSVSGCKSSEKKDSSSDLSGVTQQNKEQDFMTILYSAGDTFNPYTAKTSINKQFMTLLYDSLIKLDNNFEPVYSLAQSVVTNGKKCVVKIKSAVFSDGTTVTAEDVVYSCNLALKAKNSYTSKLYEVKSVKAAGAKTIEFVLSKSDRYFVNLLDFPIIKMGSDKKTDSDGVFKPPVGSGRYVVAKDRKSLVLNPKSNLKGGKIKTIKLINAPDSESVSHYAQIGAADMYYSDISDGNILRISGIKYDINLNNLVYIGINQNFGELKKTILRQALSTGINRTKICRDFYYNNALPASGFFNPAWEATNSVQNIENVENSEITIEKLEEIGYNRLDSRGMRLNSAGDRLEFTLLVNSENRIRVAAAKSIAEQLLQYGIKITVIEKEYKIYKRALKEGRYQLFLGEVKLTPNMDISPLVSQDGKLAFGLLKKSDGKVKSEDFDIKELEEEIKKEEEEKKKELEKTGKTEEAEEPEEEEEEKNTNSSKDVKYVVTGAQKVIKGFYSGKNTIADIAMILQTEMPFIPVCYRTGVLFCNDNIENITRSSESDIYFSIESYIINQ